MSSNALELFIETRETNDSSKCARLLENLRPDRLAVEDLINIVKWIESTAQAVDIDYLHTNIFGTGGDATVNISSLASILASEYVPIVKVGSSAVTSRYGSADFFAEFKKTRPIFHSGFRFIALSDLGFKYSEPLLAARRLLHRLHIPDIYKVVFPFANYSDPFVQINGAATSCYAKLFEMLAIAMARTVVITRSKDGFDELMPGNNVITLVKNGRCVEVDWAFLPHLDGDIRGIVAERESINETIGIYESLVSGVLDDNLTQTIYQNADLILVASGHHPVFTNGSKWPLRNLSIFNGY